LVGWRWCQGFPNFSDSDFIGTCLNSCSFIRPSRTTTSSSQEESDIHPLDAQMEMRGDQIYITHIWPRMKNNISWSSMDWSATRSRPPSTIGGRELHPHYVPYSKRNWTRCSSISSWLPVYLHIWQRQGLLLARLVIKNPNFLSLSLMFMIVLSNKKLRNSCFSLQ
jgi:hypothetical protein